MRRKKDQVTRSFFLRLSKKSIAMNNDLNTLPASSLEGHPSAVDSPTQEGTPLQQEKTGPHSRTRWFIFLGQALRNSGLLISLVVICIYFSLTAPNFVSFDNAWITLRAIAPIGIISVGMTMVIIAGEIDLGVGSIGGFAGTLVAFLAITSHWPLPRDPAGGRRDRSHCRVGTRSVRGSNLRHYTGLSDCLPGSGLPGHGGLSH